MITFFNRREVLLTEYVDVYHNALDVLQQAGIKCHSRIKGNMSGKRLNGSTKSGRTARHMNTHYYIYVHKNDRQRASAELAKYRKEIYNK